LFVVSSVFLLSVNQKSIILPLSVHNYVYSVCMSGPITSTRNIKRKKYWRCSGYKEHA